jgi:hypothetical protein
MIPDTVVWRELEVTTGHLKRDVTAEGLASGCLGTELDTVRDGRGMELSEEFYGSKN